MIGNRKLIVALAVVGSTTLLSWLGKLDMVSAGVLTTVCGMYTAGNVLAKSRQAPA